MKNKIFGFILLFSTFFVLATDVVKRVTLPQEISYRAFILKHWGTDFSIEVVRNFICLSYLGAFIGGLGGTVIGSVAGALEGSKTSPLHATSLGLIGLMCGASGGIIAGGLAGILLGLFTFPTGIISGAMRLFYIKYLMKD